MSDSPLPPLADELWPQDLRELRDGFAGKLNVYRTMAHHPELLRAWAPLRRHLVQQSALGPEQSEIVILRVGHRLGSGYEWAHHVTRARALGISDARIRAMRGAPEGEDGLIAQAVDALLDRHLIPEALEAALASAIGRKAVVDLIATVGFYLTLGGILNTYRVPVEAGIAEGLERDPI